MNNRANRRSGGVIVVVVFALIALYAQTARGSGQSAADVPPWDGSATSIVVQLRQEGGMAAVHERIIPLFTLYGDGTVVAVESAAAPSPGLSAPVWIGSLNRQQIESLLRDIEATGFWKLESSPTSSEVSEGFAVIAPQDQRSTTLLVHLADRQHEVRLYPTSDTTTPEAFQQVQQLVQTLRPADAQPYLPTSYQLTARSLGNVTTMSAAQQAALVEWPFLQIALSPDSSHTLKGSFGQEVGNFLDQEGFAVVQAGVGYQISYLGAAPR